MVSVSVSVSKLFHFFLIVTNLVSKKFSIEKTYRIRYRKYLVSNKRTRRKVVFTRKKSQKNILKNSKFCPFLIHFLLFFIISHFFSIKTNWAIKICQNLLEKIAIKDQKYLPFLLSKPNYFMSTIWDEHRVQWTCTGCASVTVTP